MSSGNARVAVAPTRLPQRQRGRDRVAALLAAAASLFVEKGYDATTMTEIAARAGASIGSLYLFFPTKPGLAQTLLTDLAEQLSIRLDALQARVAGWAPAAIGDALFAELSRFLAEHPVYSVLVDLRGDAGWKQAVRARRRSQIAALFGVSVPSLPAGQPERLAMIVPDLMRISMVLNAQPAGLQELRAMLHHHLEISASTQALLF